MLPDSLPYLVIGGVIGAWILALIGIFVLRRHYNRRLEQLGESTSEEMMAELGKAYSPSAKVRIRTQSEYLPFVIEAVREQIDSGLDEYRVQTLLQRISRHPVGQERRAVFPIELGKRTSELRLSWKRDEQERVDLSVVADPRIVRALREVKRNIPKARTSGHTPRHG